jgi:SepF-like predicted cell division protein (DUF552 family)
MEDLQAAKEQAHMDNVDMLDVNELEQQRDNPGVNVQIAQTGLTSE